MLQAPEARHHGRTVTVEYSPYHVNVFVVSILSQGRGSVVVK